MDLSRVEQETGQIHLGFNFCVLVCTHTTFSMFVTDES